MPPTPWKAIINLIMNGEPVEESTPNRPLLELTQRTQHLKDLIELLRASEAVFAHDVSVEPDAKVGHAVYYNKAAMRYERGLAKLTFDETTRTYNIAESAFIVGMIYSKASSTTADLITFGLLENFDFTSGMGSPLGENGAYYLSAQTPGTYIKQKPPVGVYLLYNRGDGAAHVAPTPREFLESHVHYKIDLYAQAAGDIVNPGGELEPVVIENADAGLPGWLPASHVSFLGLAPAGAKFGYNMAQHEEVLTHWPPLPPESSYIEINGRGVTTGETGQVIVDINGMWWMTDCYGHTPWPPGSLSSSSSSTSTCPGPPIDYCGSCYTDLDEMIMNLWFTKMIYKNNRTVVTSLAPKEGSPISITNSDGTPATLGDLIIDIQLALGKSTTASSGYNVLKDIDGTTFTWGPVVEKIKSANERLTVAGTVGNDENGYQGTITLTLEDESSSIFDGGVELISLDRVREEIYMGNLYLGYAAGREANFRGRIDVKQRSFPASATMSLWFWILGRTIGTLPNMQLEYRRLIKPNGVTVLPTVDIPLADLTPPAGVVIANQYVLAESVAFTVTAGDVVFFTLTRGSLDSYAGELGIIRMGYTIHPQL